MRAAGEQLDILGQINVWILAPWTFCSPPTARGRKKRATHYSDAAVRQAPPRMLNSGRGGRRCMSERTERRAGITLRYKVDRRGGKKRRKNTNGTRWREGAGTQGRKLSSSPWNAETTARLPGQFYTPIVSHLSYQPLPTLNLVSSLCLHLFCVSVQDVRSQAVRGSSQNVAG